MRNRTSDLRLMPQRLHGERGLFRSPDDTHPAYCLRGHWDFRVCGFGYFFLTVFRSKTSIFRFWCPCGLRIFRFFSIWFSVFAKNTNGFSDLISDAVSGRSNSPFGLQMARVVSRDFRCKQTPKVWT